MIKRAEKVSGFVFFPEGERENVKKNYKKMENFFPPFGRFFDHFLVATLPEKKIRKCFGGKEKE